MKKILFIIALSWLPVLLKAQDVHFSQFNNAPLTLNPALTGAFNADHRIIGNFRSQWGSVAKPYTTFALSYDMGILKGKLNGGFIGIGLQLFNDQAGSNKMGITQANISVSYHLPVNRTNFLTAGIQGGFMQRRIDQANMQWDNQYDPNASGGFNPDLPSGETFTYKSFNNADFSAGLLWSFNSKAATMASNDAVKFNIGVAVSHLNRPRNTFNDKSNNRMYMKSALHANAFFGIRNTNLSIVPSAVWFWQGPSHEIVAGTLFRYRLQDASRYTNFVTETALALGAYYRVGDAIIVDAQFEWKNFMLNISYDVNTSKLATASRSAGGLEVSLRYVTPIFDPKNKSLF